MKYFRTAQGARGALYIDSDDEKDVMAGPYINSPSQPATKRQRTDDPAALAVDSDKQPSVEAPEADKKRKQVRQILQHEIMISDINVYPSF
jgi:hypothetical protein